MPRPAAYTSSLLEQRSLPTPLSLEEAGTGVEGDGEKGGAHGKQVGDDEAAAATPQHRTRKCSCGKYDV